MNNGFREFATGKFEVGLAELNQDARWHDDRTDLQGPFRLAFPGNKGWGEELLVASLLKRHAIESQKPIEVFASWQVCSILEQDFNIRALPGDGNGKGRSPLAILRHALTGRLLVKPFIPLSPAHSRHSARTDRRSRVGIAWASVDDNYQLIPEKSVPLDQFLGSLAGISADFVSLQRNLKAADPDGRLVEFGATAIPDAILDAKTRDFLDALIHEIRQLDYIVTISTTTTHIAASMGIEVELIAAERRGHQWFWQVQANYQRCFYPTVQVHLGNGETGRWWERSLESLGDSLSRPSRADG